MVSFGLFLAELSPKNEQLTAVLSDGAFFTSASRSSLTLLFFRMHTKRFVPLTTGSCEKGRSTLATARSCKLQNPNHEIPEERNRPLAGAVTLCQHKIPTKESGLYGLKQTIKHEIMHALIFSTDLFAKTKPPIKLQEVEIDWYEYDHRKNRESRESMIMNVIRTPYVMAFLRKHLQCAPNAVLLGAPLENINLSGSKGSFLALARKQWHKYLVLLL